MACPREAPDQAAPAPSPASHAAAPGSQAATGASSSPSSAGRAAVKGTAFVNPDGSRFHWRGITAFRLVEQIAHGRENEAAAYLDWARDNGVTVLRVLAMAKHLFELTPEDGLSALPRLLTLAADRGLSVEVVALADTASYDVDLDAHVIAVGKIAAEHPNAFVEVANEPFHGTQDRALHERETLIRLAALIPADVVVALGSERTLEETMAIERAAGDYVTVHTPRGGGPWNHVRALAAGAALVEKVGRPVVSDEPVGAAPRAIRGRRDDSAERFRAAALLTRMTGMHATFHYEGGLQGRIPEGPELEAFSAWKEAWTLLPDDIETGDFLQLETTGGASFQSRAQGCRWTLTIEDAPAPEGATLVARWPESALWRH